MKLPNLFWGFLAMLNCVLSAMIVVPLLVFSSMALSKDYYVHADIGDNASSGRSSNAAFADLEYAMMKLDPGDTLFVRAGVYKKFPLLSSEKYQSGTSTNPIRVRSYAGELPVISDNSDLRIADVSWWVFEKLTFQSAGTVKLGGTESGKCLTYVSNIAFRKNRFQHSSNAGIKIQCGRRIAIEDNFFDNLRSRKIGRDLHAITAEISTDEILISGNLFRDIGADGIQLAGTVGKTSIVSNVFEVQRPYYYRDENGEDHSITHHNFGNVGENAIDIKSGPGPILIEKNKCFGFRPSVAGQDVSGSNGVAIVIHNNASNITLRRNYFEDNVDHLRILKGAGSSSEHPRRSVRVNNNIFADTAYYGERKPSSLYLEGISDVRIYNNTFYNREGSGKRILRLRNLSDIEISNNIFHNGEVEVQKSHVLEILADHNAWSDIAGSINESLKGSNDLNVFTPQIDETSWTPLLGSSLIDAGKPVGLDDDFYGNAINGSGPDIGAVEYGR
ncbi:right-handed parallel beta-helix repeat-containing protein [Pseudohalioglobus lutimaris]|uniref:Right handed beta helix domain-containing protein n=1 Tax=Pseudohalioglobus lutimaris TaxID=1737061 RepID=A0A2N5WXR2_9GAMM|nr:right-handed parallel beta-helix repeat-containing protein [Pseudohalioglobus lutimaris]PLW67041.1 hypothetical protein C0039_18665 [Pseudohalioglobus lutimaris]